MEEVGIGFMMSPNYHPAMKTFATVRRKLKVQTVFNILGPMLNPARAPFSVVGVCKEEMVGYLLPTKTFIRLPFLDAVLLFVGFEL